MLPQPALRLSVLDITHAVLVVVNKLPAANKLLAELGFVWEQTAVMGDDWPNLPLLHRAQLTCTPANGHHENRAMAHFTSRHMGSSGAVRQLCDLILIAQGHYARCFERALAA